VTTRPAARIRAFRRCLVAGAALCVLATTLSIPGGAAPRARHRVVVVEPATNLTDAVVSVSWSGFRPSQPDGSARVQLLQCRANPKSVLRDCNTEETFPFSLNGNQQLGTTGKDGTGHVFMDIMTTARLPSLACSETHPCSLLAFETTSEGYNPNGLPPNRVIVPLTFEHSFGDCPPVQTFDFRMETESSAAPALYQWAADFCTGAHAFTVDVTNTSSNSARENFASNQVDIAVTSLPPEPGELGPASPKFSVVPLDLTAVVLAYNITDPVSHKPVTDLTLSPRLVARLISDSDLTSFFRDPELRKLNPHHHWPGQVAAPGLRAEKNADTWIVTNWLNGNPVARKFLNGKDPYGVAVASVWKGVHYPTDIFEARLPDGVYFPRVGEEGVAQRLFSETKPAESIPTDALNAGFIGVLDLPTAARFRLPIARLTNGVGQPVVSLDGLSATGGFDAMQTSPAGFHTEPARVPKTAYPLMKVDSAMVPAKLTGSDRDLRIRAFLDRAVTDGQKDLPAGYAGLPRSLQLQTLRYTGDTQLADEPTTTTTTTTTTTQPSGLGAGGGGNNGYAGGSGGGEYNGGGTDYTGGGPAASTPNATPTSAPRKRSGASTTTTTTRPVATLAGLRLSDSGDRLVLPVVLILGAIALLVRAAAEARNRTRGWRLRR
jgi:hypothetical protein